MVRGKSHAFLFLFFLQLGRNTALCQIHQFGIIHTRKIEQREEIPGPASRGIIIVKSSHISFSRTKDFYFKSVLTSECESDRTEGRIVSTPPSQRASASLGDSSHLCSPVTRSLSWQDRLLSRPPSRLLIQRRPNPTTKLLQRGLWRKAMSRVKKLKKKKKLKKNLKVQQRASREGLQRYSRPWVHTNQILSRTHAQRHLPV